MAEAIALLTDMSEPHEALELFCGPCCDEGQKLSVSGFCVNCQDYLCALCYEHHRRARPFREHVLMSETDMPRLKSPTTADGKATADNFSMTIDDSATTGVCSKHSNEVIRFLCRSHDQQACSMCVVIDHRCCDKISFVEEEIKEFQSSVKTLTYNLDSKSETIKREKETMDMCHENAIKDIEEFAKEISNLFASFKSNIKSAVDSIKEANSNKISKISAVCTSFENEIKIMVADVDILRNSKLNGQMFTVLDKAKDKLKDIEQELSRVKDENNIQRYAFVPEKGLLDMIRNLKILGQLSKEDKTTEEVGLEKSVHKDGKDNEVFKEIDDDLFTANNTSYNLLPKQHDKYFIKKLDTDGNGDQIDHPLIQNTTTTNTVNKTKMIPTEGQMKKQDAKEPGERKSYFEKLIRTNRPKGNLQLNRNPTHLNKIKTFKLKRVSHETLTNIETSDAITGMTVLPNNKLIVCDKKIVKLTDIRQMTVISQLQLLSVPWDITTVDENQVAITLPDEQCIQIVFIAWSMLVKGQAIRVKGQCLGIVHNEGMFILTFARPPTGKFIDMSEKVLKHLRTNFKGRQLFVKPMYITMNLERTLTYISDSYNHTVTCISLDGVVNGVYNNELLKYPHGVAVDREGYVYVCAGAYPLDVYNIYQISSDCTRGRLLRQVDGGCGSHPMAYWDKEDKLYVRYWNQIKVLLLK